MMPKMVFFDIDDTVYRKDTDTLRPSVAKAVEKLRAKGILTAVATGRAPATIPEKVRSMAEKSGMDALVTINGQYVLFQGGVLHSAAMDVDTLASVCRRLDETGTAYAFVGSSGIAVSSKTPRVCRALCHIVSDFVEDRGFFKHEPVYQMLVFVDKEEEPLLSDEAEGLGLKCVRWHEEAVDLLPAGASKVDGIRCVAEKLGIGMADVMAFGDGLNDVEMLSQVGFGVAMGNGAEAAKQAARYVCPSVDEDGVFEGLKRLGVI